MPIHEYLCEKCDKPFEYFQRSISSAEAAKCPACGSTQTSRQLSVFAVGAEQSRSAAMSSGPGMCGRCGGPGPCGSE